MPNKITKTSKNTNCLRGMKCPKCGQEDSLEIEATCIFTVTDDGTEDGGYWVDWEDTNYCECPDCGHSGAVADFTIEKWDREQETVAPIPVPATAEFYDFVALISRMTQDGEEIDGEEFVMENDDAVDTVNDLIDQARALILKATNGAPNMTQQKLTPCQRRPNLLAAVQALLEQWGKGNLSQAVQALQSAVNMELEA